MVMTINSINHTALVTYVKKFFTDRVINVWNSLPSTVNFTSVMTFRRSLNNVDFGSHIHCRLE